MEVNTEVARACRAAGGCLVAAVVVLGALELVSFILLRVTEGRWMTYGELREGREKARASSQEGYTAVGGVEPEGAVFSGMGRDVIHPYVGFVLDREFAVARRRSRAGEEGMEYGFNLGGALFQSPQSGRVVVAITGGSVAHGFALRHGDLLRRELMRLRPELGDVVILNLALPGYKQPQQLMAAAWLLTLGARFDALVNIDGFNDVALAPIHNIPRGVFPFFPRDWDLRVRALDPEVSLTAGQIEVLRQERGRRAAAFSSWPLGRSMTASLVWRRLDKALSGRINRLQAALLERRGPGAESYQATGPRRVYADEAAMYEDLVATWKRSSFLMDRLVRGSGAVYVHFLQPSQYVPGSKPMGPEERRTAVHARGIQAQAVRAAYPLLARAGGELSQDGVRFTDLTWLFAGERESLYVDPCCHFNERGNELLAQAVARVLTEELARSPTGVATRDSTEAWKRDQ